MMKLRLGSTDLVVFQVIEEREPRSWEANGQGLTERWWSGEDQALPPASWAAALLMWPHPDSLAGHSLTAPHTYPRGIRSKTLSGCPRPWIVLNPVHTAVSYTNGRVVYTGWRVGGQETSLCHLEWVHSSKSANYFQDFPFNAVGGELTVGNWNHGKWNQGRGGGDYCIPTGRAPGHKSTKWCWTAGSRDLSLSSTLRGLLPILFFFNLVTPNLSWNVKSSSLTRDGIQTPASGVPSSLLDHREVPPILLITSCNLLGAHHVLGM